MAATGRPRFQVDPGFNDSREVLSIPRRWRLAARGAWEAAGCWSCNKLTDGWVPVSALRELGVTPMLADFLMDAGLWVPGASRVTLPSVDDSGDVVDVLDVGPRPDVWTLHVGPTSVAQFANWPKWQMTRAKWLKGRASAAERAKTYRSSKKGAGGGGVTRDDNVMQLRLAIGAEDAVTRDASHRRVVEEKYSSRELSAVGSADGPPPPEFPDHCSKHRHDPEPPKCNDCRRTRELNHHGETEAANRAAAERAEAARRRRECTRCGGHGFVEVDPTDPDPWAPTMRCPDCTP